MASIQTHRNPEVRAKMLNANGRNFGTLTFTTVEDTVDIFFDEAEFRDFCKEHNFNIEGES